MPSRRANRQRLLSSFAPISEQELLEEVSDVEMTDAASLTAGADSEGKTPRRASSGSDPDLMSIDNPINANTGANTSQDMSQGPARHGALAEEPHEDSLRRLKLKIVLKRKRFAPSLHEELLDAQDAPTLQALLDLVGSSMKTLLDPCNIGMPGLLRVEGYLPGLRSLSKAAAQFVGCCMGGSVRDPTIEMQWGEFLRAVEEASRRWQGGGGYEGDDEGNSIIRPANSTWGSRRFRRSDFAPKVKARVVLFFC